MSTNNPLIIDVIEDNLDKETVAHIPPNIGVRAVFFLNNKVCLVHYESTDRYTLPGGGKEKNETFTEALAREIKEETGYTMLNATPSVIIREYFTDSVWHHHFYSVQVEKQAQANALTGEEETLGLKPVFKPLNEALEILAFQPTHRIEHKQINNRELLGLMLSIEK